jgi:hypothetical protein
MRRRFAIAAAICVLGAVEIAGCAALARLGVNKVEDLYERNRLEHAISWTQFRGLERGMTEHQVISGLGKAPADRGDYADEGLLSAEPPQHSCIYYGIVGASGESAFQLCFDHGKLRRKTPYRVGALPAEG